MFTNNPNDRERDPIYTQPHTHAHAQARRGRFPKVVLPLLLLALLLIGYLGTTATQHQQAYHNDTAYQNQAGLPAAPLAIAGRAWVPAGPIQLLPDRQMIRMGRTVGGDDLFAKPTVATVGGGGGGAIDNNRAVPADNTIYLRIGDDRYQPMVLAHVVP